MAWSKPFPGPHCFPWLEEGCFWKPGPWCFFGSSLGGQRCPEIGTSEEQVELLMLCPAAAFDHTPLPQGPLMSLGAGLDGLGGLRKPLGQRQ